MTSISDRREGVIDLYSCPECQSLYCSISSDLQNQVRIEPQPSQWGKFIGHWVWIRNQSIGLIKYFAPLGCDKKWEIAYSVNKEGYKATLHNNPIINFARLNHDHTSSTSNDTNPNLVKKFKSN